MNPIDAALVRIPIGTRLKKQEEALVSRLVGICTAESNVLTMQKAYGIGCQIAALRNLAASLEGDARQTTETRFKEINSAR